MTSQAAHQVRARIGANLRSYRLQRDLTQRQLGQFVDVEGFQVSRWESGAVRPSDARLMLLADKLGISYADFFADSEAAA